jgi:hypothetical protein
MLHLGEEGAVSLIGELGDSVSCGLDMLVEGGVPSLQHFWGVIIIEHLVDLELVEVVVEGTFLAAVLVEGGYEGLELFWLQLIPVMVGVVEELSLKEMVGGILHIRP